MNDERGTMRTPLDVQVVGLQGLSDSVAPLPEVEQVVHSLTRGKQS